MHYRSPYREARQTQRLQNMREIVTATLFAALFVGMFLLALSRAEYIISIH